MSNSDTRQLQVTLVRSTAHCLAAHQATVRGLGLRRMNSSAVVSDTPATRGMIKKISYLLKVEEV